MGGGTGSGEVFINYEGFSRSLSFFEDKKMSGREYIVNVEGSDRRVKGYNELKDLIYDAFTNFGLEYIQKELIVRRGA